MTPRIQKCLLIAAVPLLAWAQMPMGGGRDMAWEQQRMMQQMQQAQRQIQMQQSMLRMQQQQQLQIQIQQEAQRRQQLQNQAEAKVAQDAKQVTAPGEPGAAWSPEKPSKVLWSVPTKTRGQVPVFDGSRLVVALDNKVLQSLDVDSGKALWEATDAEGRACSPLLEGDRVIYVTNDYRLLFRDMATGKLLQDIKVDGWSRFLMSNKKEHPTVMAPVVEGGKLLVATYGKNGKGSADGQIHAYDLVSGKLLWEYPLAGGPDLAPAVAGDKVIIGGAGHVLALGLGDGKLAWYFQTDSVFNHDLAGGEVIEGRYCFFSGSTLYALDPAKGTKLWNQDISDGLPILMGAGDRVVLQQARKAFGTKDWVLALDAKTGAKAWERKLGSTQMPWVQNGRVYCNSEDQAFALDLATGQPQWATKLEDNLELPLMPAGGSTLAVTHSGDNTTIHALDTKDGKEQWSYSFAGEVGSGLLVPHGKGFYFPGEKGEVIAIR